ncbi:hypothetical protein AVEN_38365-1 [Araneus ventricosus]|uniref:Uncharacterized protein n=1 Tax=Araneus ventricosus TaxID=182803 RepID=A0A4Y2J5S5_ARAVE|nr:hypothetical protein AVEN_38365-1 [Araneus ventricosus]
MPPDWSIGAGPKLLMSVERRGGMSKPLFLEPTSQRLEKRRTGEMVQGRAFDSTGLYSKSCWRCWYQTYPLVELCKAPPGLQIQG